MKKLFTLIELIVVIVVLGILAAIVIPNISNIKGDATQTAIKTNEKGIQDAVDIYSLNNGGEYPTMGYSIEDTYPVNLEELDPEYIRSLPKVKDIKHWINRDGKVFSSTADSPTGVNMNSTTLVWDKVEEAASYKIYKINEVNLESSAKSNGKFIFVTSTTETTITLEEGVEYFVSSVDSYDLESPPVSSNYIGYDKLYNMEDSIKFNGKDTAVRVPHNDILDGMNDSLTIEFWMKTDSITEDYIINKFMHYTGTGMDDSYLVNINDRGEIEVRLSGTVKTNQTVIRTKKTINDNKWHHIAYVWDRPNSYIYIDGELDERATTKLFDEPVHTYNSYLDIGGRSSDRVEEGIEDFFKGSLSDIRIWNTAKTKEELNNDKYKELKGNESGLIGNWKLYDTDGKTVTDHSTYKNNGEIFKFDIK